MCGLSVRRQAAEGRGSGLGGGSACEPPSRGWRSLLLVRSRRTVKTMGLRRNYWVYSAGLALAWAAVFAIRAAIGDQATMDTVLKVFAGFVIGWVSTTIARYIYPPPAKWTQPLP
jgi:hypothetical protein